MQASEKRKSEYFRSNLRIMVTLLTAWAVFSFGGILLAPTLNRITFMGFPLGYYMGSQGALVVFLVVIFLNAILMDRLDRRTGLTAEQVPTRPEGPGTRT